MATKFYQDPEERMIRGVCAGLARGLGVDPIWMRVLFGGLFIGGLFTAGISSGLVFVIYIVLALVMPTRDQEQSQE